MATCSSFLAWRIPWTEEPGKLQSMESQRVGHALVTEHMSHITVFLQEYSGQARKWTFREDQDIVLTLRTLYILFDK